MKRYIPILCILTVVLTFGCHKDQPAARITMAEGSLSVENLSNVDIYPVVQAGREESFGVVPTGGGAKW